LLIRSLVNVLTNRHRGWQVIVAANPRVNAEIRSKLDFGGYPAAAWDGDNMPITTPRAAFGRARGAWRRQVVTHPCDNSPRPHAWDTGSFGWAKKRAVVFKVLNYDWASLRGSVNTASYSISTSARTKSAVE